MDNIPIIIGGILLLIFIVPFIKRLIHHLLIMIELTIIMFIVLFSPFWAFQYSILLGYFSIVPVLVFIYFYFITKKGYSYYVDYLRDSSKVKVVRMLILISFLPYSIAITYYSYYSIEEDYKNKISEIVSHMDEYTSSWVCNDEENIEDFPKKGLVIIDMDDLKIDKLNRMLPDSVLALKASDVEFLIQIWRYRFVTNHYTDGGKAIQQNLTYKIIDYHKSKCIYYNIIKSPPPELKEKGRDECEGQDPILKLKEKIIRK